MTGNHVEYSVTIIIVMNRFDCMQWEEAEGHGGAEGEGSLCSCRVW